MSANELTSWAKYFAVEPHNSVEVQLAYLSLQVGSFMGAKNKTIEDYLITVWKAAKKKAEPIIINTETFLSMFGVSTDKK